MIFTKSYNFNKKAIPGSFGVTVTAAVINEEGKILLGKRATNRANGGDWELINGRVDCGENIDEALHREVLEEVGLIVEIKGVLGFKHYRRSPDDLVEYQGIVFNCKIENNSPNFILNKNETTEVRWFRFEDAVKICADYELPFIQLLLNNSYTN